MYKKSAMTNRIVLRTLVLAFAVMVFAGGDLKGQETLTVYDGTYQNQYVPIYGNWCDANQKNQIIYPASMLADIYGGQISALTFYFASGASGAASSWNNNFKVLIGETSSSRFDSNEYINFTATTVFDGTITDSINTSTNQLTIHFSSPYTYNCGNLIKDR